MSKLRKIKRALISVSDKTGLADFAASLAGFGVQIISTGGTAKSLRENGLKVVDVSDVTGFPEMMNGRVKTLHPKIHGAFLALRDDPGHVASMDEHGIKPIDLVVVNLYPFEQTIAKEGASLEEAVENIDIGGPAMIRSAAKNWRDVAVVTDPANYGQMIDEMAANDGCLSINTRSRLATEAYARTARYDASIAAYLAIRSAQAHGAVSGSGVLGTIFAAPSMEPANGETTESTMEDFLGLGLRKACDLRYGENPHQHAALYLYRAGGIASADLLHGKEMSFNNYVDAEAAWNLVNDFDELAVAIIKHTNPSGVGVGLTNEDAYRRALATDPVSAFGGIVAFNRTVNAAAAKLVTEVFTEVVIAPGYDDEAISVLCSKKNLRVLKMASPNQSEISNLTVAGFGNTRPPSGRESELEYKQISGGFLVQERDVHRIQPSDLNIVTDRHPTAAELRSMLLAWNVCKQVKSNAIVFANEHQTLGVGAGQMNRVDSLRIAAMRAERFDLLLKGSAVASDAFFPFRDNVDEAAKYGVSAIIQPGGSIKDEESISAANEHGIAMVFTGVRHFKH